MYIQVDNNHFENIFKRSFEILEEKKKKKKRKEKKKQPFF